MYKLSIDTTNKFQSKPNNTNFNSINANIVNGWASYSLDEIVNHITTGSTFSCGQFEDKHKAAKWQGQQLFGIDIDSHNSPTPERAIAIINEKFNANPIITYNTFSSNSTNNKYRILISTDEVIVEPKLAIAILRGLVNELRADIACIDLARIFYGTTSNKLIQSSNDVVSIDKLRDFAQNYKPKHQAEASIQSNKRNGVVSINGLTVKQKKLLLLHIEKFWTPILHSQEPSRFECIKKVIVGSKNQNGFPMMRLDFMSVELAVELLMDIIVSNPNLTTYYINDYDKDARSMARKLAVWANSMFGDELVNVG